MSMSKLCNTFFKITKNSDIEKYLRGNLSDSKSLQAINTSSGETNYMKGQDWCKIVTVDSR